MHWRQATAFSVFLLSDEDVDFYTDTSVLSVDINALDAELANPFEADLSESSTLGLMLLVLTFLHAIFLRVAEAISLLVHLILSIMICFAKSLLT